MLKVKKAFFRLIDLPSRWGYSLADIGGWAIAGRLQIVLPIGPVKCGEEIIAGVVTVSATDVARLLYGGGSPERTCLVQRILPQETFDWQFITEPAQGIEVRLADLILPAHEVEEFEQVNELLALGGKPARRIGRRTNYDWEHMLVDVLIEVITEGLPRTQEDFFKLMLDWFVERSPDGDIPDASTVRKRFARVWWWLQEKL